MLLTDITKIIRVLLAAFETVASQDDLTQRRIGQIGQVIGAVEDVAETEEDTVAPVAEKRVEEAHDIIHRIAAILAMEDGRGESENNDAENDESGSDEIKNDANDPTVVKESSAGYGGASSGPDDDQLREVPWDGKFVGETIELKEDEEE